MSVHRPISRSLAGLTSALLFFASAVPAAALFSISAETDKQSLEINDSLYLTVTVSGDSASVPEPTLPRMDNFNIYSSGRSQNISMVNGKISTSVSFTYILAPRFIGKQKIPPISVFNGREKHFTREIEIDVRKASPPPQAQQQPARQPKPAARQRRPAQARAGASADDMIYMTAQTDKNSAYPNEQVNLTIRLYNALPLTSNPQYLPPQLKNLIAEDLPPAKNGETVINNIPYSYSEIRTALFGIEEGKASISPATVIAQVHTGAALDPFDPNFFQQFFSMGAAQGETREVKSSPAALTIKPLPPGAPDSFNGAVGELSLSAELDRREAKAGEALNLSVTISGKGNLKTLTAPKLPDMPDFKVYDTMSSLNISKSGDVIGGKKVFTTILIPRTEGKRVIPRVKFSFLDPASGTYKELAAGPFEITVRKGDGNGKAFSFAPGEQSSAITPLASDIRYVSDKAVPPPGSALAARINAMPAWLNLLPVLAAMLSLWLARLSEFRSKNPGLFRFRKAQREARADIAAASEKLENDQPGEAASILYDSLLAYLYDKSGHKVSGLTMKRTLTLLREKFPGAGEATLADVKDLWEALEALHFSPGGAARQEALEMLEKYSALLPVMEKEFKK